MLETLLKMMHLKEQVRTGWTLRGVNAPESVADHSWGTALLCQWHAGEADVDRSRAVEMALIHDLAESVTGDVATRVASMNDPAVKQQKQARERAAMEQLIGRPDSLVGSGEPGGGGEAGPAAGHIRALWEEYEAGETPVARFVRDMNLIDMCMQALVYEREGRYSERERETDAAFPDFRGLEEFFATTEPRLSTETGKWLFEELRRLYGELPSVRARRGW